MPKRKDTGRYNLRMDLPLLLISYPVRHISTSIFLFEPIPVVHLSWKIHIQICGERDQPNGSHRYSRRAILCTRRSILKAESRNKHAPWSTNSWVVWVGCGILNLQPLPAERSKIFWKMSVNMWLAPGKLFQPDKSDNQSPSINRSPLILSLIFAHVCLR